MPHLQFEVSTTVEDVGPFVEWVTDRYGEVMETGTGHVAVTVREAATVTMGRADGDDPVALLNADVRAGRSFAQRREFAMDTIAEIADRWNVPGENVYVIYTEHPGEDFFLQEGPLDSWSADEREEGALDT